MATRRYGHYCAIAKSLDVLGDRWAMLIVRELLFGAMRYSELQAALPGVATDMLAARLRQLDTAGVITRDTDNARHYRLTDRGQALRPVLEALAVWGLGELTERSPDEPFAAKWMALPIAGLIRADRARDITLSVRLIADSDEIILEFDNGDIAFPTAGSAVDVTIEGPPDALAAAITGARPTTERGIEVHGDPDHIDQLLYILGLRNSPDGQRH